jgi:hypothetical protein
VPKEEEKPKKEVNLFDFGDDDVLDAPAAVPAVSGGAAIGAQSAAMLGGDGAFILFNTFRAKLFHTGEAGGIDSCMLDEGAEDEATAGTMLSPGCGNICPPIAHQWVS